MTVSLKSYCSPYVVSEFLLTNLLMYISTKSESFGRSCPHYSLLNDTRIKTRKGIYVQPNPRIKYRWVVEARKRKYDK